MGLLRNPDARHLDFEAFQGIFPNPRALPCDIDFFMERTGKFIAGEWKRDREKMSEGQRIALQSLARLPQFTVLVVRGHTDGGKPHIEKFWRVVNGRCRQIGYGYDDYVEYCQAWWNYADRTA